LHAFDVANRGVERQARFQPADRLEMLTAAAGEGLRSVVANQRPHFGTPVKTFRDERLERRRHHAGDRERLIVHRDDPADCRRIGIESPPPQTVAQDHHPPAVRRVFVRSEVAAQDGAYAERPKEIRRHTHAANPLRLAVGDERGRPRSDERDLFEAVAAIAPVEIGRVSDVACGSIRTAIADQGEPLRRRVRERPQQHGIHDAEDRGVGADAKRERDERDPRERRSLPEQPRRIPDIAAEIEQQMRAFRGRHRRSGARPVGARDFRGDVYGIVEGRERSCHGLGVRNAGRHEIRVMLGDMLCQLVEDVGLTRGVDRHRGETRADERLPVLHGTLLIRP
jgi:hypothetical protein